MAKLIQLCLNNKFIVIAVLLLVMGAGVINAPFDWNLPGGIERSPVPVDAIPDTGENQQIVFTRWAGYSPQDIEDQVTYPLTVALLGIPEVKTVRSFSMFGFSTVYVIFKEKVDFYWSRTRILEKLNSLPPGTLPEGVKPTLGPDATALGQVFWYTLEGHNEKGEVVGGWNPEELRTIQDFNIRYQLMSADGVSEVASIGGFVREYQIDIDPDAMRAFGVSIEDIVNATKQANTDVGAKTIEVNRVEYVVRGIGKIQKIEDLEQALVKTVDGVPIKLSQVANISTGPALRRGLLDKEGAEAVGGVVVTRYGVNPMQTIKNVKKRIAEIQTGLPKKTLKDGSVSQVTIVPFYDRTKLIKETLNTLNEALVLQVIITVIVVLLMVMHLRSSVLISSMLPAAILFCFVMMKAFGVDANIVSLSGIAIAIGTIVDMGIVICENCLKHLQKSHVGESKWQAIFTATNEVGSAVLTAVATTVVSFLPVFTMEAAEGKLFKPLAFTKTFALIASIILALTVLPVFIGFFFSSKRIGGTTSVSSLNGKRADGAATSNSDSSGGVTSVSPLVKYHEKLVKTGNMAVGLAVTVFLGSYWMPLGPAAGPSLNILFTMMIVGGLLGFFWVFEKCYTPILRWCLDHKILFLILPAISLYFGWQIWQGLGKEFMPPLDEGAFLYMPTTMPHASIEESKDAMRKQDMAMTQIHEVETAVGKLGRVESALDPAPISMVETIINYYPEYLSDENGNRLTFKFDAGEMDLFRDQDGNSVPAYDGKPYYVQGKFIRDENNKLIADENGESFRIWRPELDPKLNPGREAWSGVKSQMDIWDRIVEVAQVPGSTSAPYLQPISARIVMLQSGMRAPIGIKVYGDDLDKMEKVSLKIEELLKSDELKTVNSAAVLADRLVGKPYLEIHIDRKAAARYGISVDKLQKTVEMAVGGRAVTTTIEGRERYAVRIRYMREKRDSIEELNNILITTGEKQQIPLKNVAEIKYIRGPQNIKSEDTRLVTYVLLDKNRGTTEVDVAEEIMAYLKKQQDIFDQSYRKHVKDYQRDLTEEEKELLPGLYMRGTTFKVAGSFENQVRAEKRLMIILPVALILIFMILYMQFRSFSTTLIIFSSIAVAWSGGFIMVYFYGQEWFMNFSLFGVEMRELFQISPINLSVAVWVGFLALFGIASDDGVVMGTYLVQRFDANKPADKKSIRQTVIEAGQRRIKPCLMTTATTIIALLPILTSTGRGSDIMVPMAIPTFGGMVLEILTMLVVPVLYCALQEFKLFFKSRRIFC